MPGTGRAAQPVRPREHAKILSLSRWPLKTAKNLFFCKTAAVLLAGILPSLVSADAALDALRARHPRPAMDTAAAILDVANADKIVWYGVSSTESAYALRGKSWVSKLAQRLDYICFNQGRSTQLYDEYAYHIRTGNLVGCAPGLSLPDLRPAYIFLVSSVANPGVGGWGGPPDPWNSTLLMHGVENAVRAVIGRGARPVIGADQSMCGSRMLDSLLFDYAARRAIPYAAIGSVGEQINNTSYAPYWPGNHPATRSNAVNTEEWLYYLSQMPGPLRGLKIFRKRSALPLNGDLQRLNFEGPDARERLFVELEMGDSCLRPEAEPFCDRLDEYFSTGRVATNEYTVLLAGSNAVPFVPDRWGDAVGLFEFTFDAVMPETVTVYVAAEGPDLEFSLKNHRARPGEWKPMKGAVFGVAPEVFERLDASYVGQAYTSDVVTAEGQGGVLVYQGKYRDYNVGPVVCLHASTTIGRRNWLSLAPGVLQHQGGDRDIPHTGFVHLRKDLQFFDSLQGGFGEWQRVPAAPLSNGYWTVRLDAAQARACVEGDRLKLLVRNRAGFAVRDVVAASAGGEPKTRQPFTGTVPKRQFRELFPTNLFGPALEDSGWTNASAHGVVRLEAMPAVFADYPEPDRQGGYVEAAWATTHGLRHCALGVDADGRPGMIARRVTLARAGVGYRHLVFRAVARTFPPNYIRRDPWNPASNYLCNATVFHQGRFYRNAAGSSFTSRGSGSRGNQGQEPAPDSKFWTPLDAACAPFMSDTPSMTPDSYDLGTLCLGLKLPNKLSWKVIKRTVQVGWSEIYVDTWLPPAVKEFDVALFKDPWDFVDTNYHNHEFPLHLFYTSLQVEGE